MGSRSADMTADQHPTLAHSTNLESSVKDPALREKRRLDHRAGCKRLIMSENFYDAIQRPNARLVTKGIERLENTGEVARPFAALPLRCQPRSTVVVSTAMKTATGARPHAAQDATLYEADFFEWTQRTADQLRRRRFDEADIEHVAEEIEDMGKRDPRELNSRMEVLLAHLLKWKLQRRKRSNSWRATIVAQRREIAAVLKDSPNLRARLVAAGKSNYAGAVDRAAAEAGLEVKRFPPNCPFSNEEILDLRFLPAGAPQHERTSS